MTQPISIFIGVDPQERAATNVLIDSLIQLSSRPLAITPMLTPQLEQQGLYWLNAIRNKAQTSHSAVLLCLG